GSMLGLILANNYLELYIFWELVGLCSYLLIGFWFERPAAAAAGMKAFIVTRIGDLFFLFGIILLYTNFGTFNFLKLFGTQVGPEQAGLLKLITFLIFMGAVGKSAQFPLHVWLPDAMEGPSTVSALIHAATMVKAGVYLVARSYPLFVHSPETMLLVAGIGGFTALFTATMALVNNDIKRILAFSTISQLGYMMLGLGASGYAFSLGALGAPGFSASMFHLLNHAFFKALLFLGAGAVMHGLHDELDIRRMGGLHRKMPITSVTMLIAALAISGIPPFSGFWSKDAVLEAVFAVGEGNWFVMLLWLFGIITVFLTAFYMFRWWFLIFGSRPRYEGEAHESPPIMTGPLAVLAGFAVVSGIALFGLPKFLHYGVLRLAAAQDLLQEIFTNPLTYLSLGLALAGILLAWVIYQREWLKLERFSTKLGRWSHRLLLNRYYLNDAYIGLARSGVYGFSIIIDLFDRYIIDGLVNGVGWGSRGLGERLRRTVSGFVGDYASWIIGGLVVILLIYI
ncbi:MAG: NADH-quinone oxidoreductase subunit L, partial [Candidatus Bipolaricaulia bacterium]